jgi:hypothetical protein
MYCGGNRLHRPLLNGEVELGTRYQCMKKGISKGLNLPYDNNYLNDYEPLYPLKLWCGKSDQLPENYDKIGTPPECLRYGIGIGKRKKALDGGDFNIDDNNNKKSRFLFFILIEIVLFITIYYTKPTFLLKKDDNDKIKSFDYTKFVFFYILLSIIIFKLLI